MDNIAGDVPKQSLENAKKVIAYLKKNGYKTKDLRKLRIGVVGTSGSGKSSMARAFEQELGLERKSLDKYLRLKGLDGKAALSEVGAPKPGSVFEQSQLMHQLSPDHFDVVVNVSRPTRVIKKDLRKRGVGAITADYTDFDKARRAVDTSFELSGARTGGQVSEGLRVAISPNASRAEQQRLSAAQAAGFDLNQFGALSQADQIMSIAKGKIVNNRSWASQTANKNMQQDIGIGSALVFGGGGVGYRQAQKKEAFLIPALGAAAGAGAGAIMGGEENRVGGAISGALVGTGLGLGAKALTVGTAKKVKGAITPTTKPPAPPATPPAPIPPAT